MLTWHIEQIKHIFEECGAKFEDRDIGDCTHLITTSKSMDTQKGELSS